MTSLASVRLFRRSLGLRYDGIVHNQLRIDPSEPILRIDASIEHLGYDLSPEKMAAKAARTIGLLEKQLQEDPDSAFALFNYAQALLGQDFGEHPENAAKVVELAGRAVDLTDPESGGRGERRIHLMALEQVALASFIGADYERAESFALRAVEQMPDFLDALLLLGNLYLQTSRFDLAEEYYNRYLETQARTEGLKQDDEIIMLHPRSRYRAWFGLGVIAENRREWEKAGRYFRNTLDINPEFMDANQRHGRALFNVKDFVGAEESFKRQLELDSGSPGAIVGLASVCYLTGRDGEAQRLLDGLSAPVEPSLIEYLEMLEDAGQPQQAAGVLDLVAATETPSVGAKRHLAGACFRHGRYAEAASLYQEVLESGGGSRDLLNNLAGCFFKLEDYVRAEEYYQQAVAGESPPVVALRNLGVTRARLGKAAEAIPVLEEYLQLVPNQHDISHLAGDLCVQTGNYEGAVGHYERILRVRSDDTLALFRLSEAYLHMGHRDSAILGYRRVLELEEDFQPARKRLAELMEPVGET